MRRNDSACGLVRAADDVVRDRKGLVDRNDKHPHPRLRHESRRIDHDRAEAVAGVREGVADRGEILAVVRRQQADDVFDHDEARRPTLGT